MKKIINGQEFTLESEDEWVCRYVAESQDRATFSKIIEGTFNWDLLKGSPDDLPEDKKISAAIMLYGEKDSRVPDVWREFAVAHLNKIQEESMAEYTEEEIAEIHREIDQIEKEEQENKRK